MDYEILSRYKVYEKPKYAMGSLHGNVQRKSSLHRTFCVKNTQTAADREYRKLITDFWGCSLKFNKKNTI